MKRNYSYAVAILLLLSPCLCSAQSLSSHAESNGGGYLQASGYTLQYTIGELNVTSYTAGGTTITQGFQQNQVTITGISEAEKNSLLKIYPNPASTEIIIDAASMKQDISGIHFTDVTGRLMNIPVNVSSSIITCDISSLSNGTYILIIEGNDTPTLYSYKIIKASSR